MMLRMGSLREKQIMERRQIGSLLALMPLERMTMKKTMIERQVGNWRTSCGESAGESWKWRVTSTVGLV
jgi:hypothetical protein